MLKSIFDVEIETGDGNRKLEKVTVKPNPDVKGVLSVFLEEKGSEPRKYYDLSLEVKNGNPVSMSIVGDERCQFIEIQGIGGRKAMELVDEIDEELVIIGLIVFLERSFKKLKIEATYGKILFTFT